ncbi:chorismate--pyruvate lyase family protein [Marinobacter sp. 1Y8]
MAWTTKATGATRPASMPLKDSDIPDSTTTDNPHRRVPRAQWFPSIPAAQLIADQSLTGGVYWLTVEGSLTRALQLRCRHSFHVDILWEGYARPTAEEARALALPPRQHAWIREVNLCGDGEPWVMARTVIPLATLKGAGRRLRHLGRQPLGAFLFRHRRWHRGAFQTGLTQSATPDQPGIGRRSRFSKGSRALLVGEYFYPRLLEQTNGEH